MLLIDISSTSLLHLDLPVRFTVSTCLQKVCKDGFAKVFVCVAHFATQKLVFFSHKLIWSANDEVIYALHKIR